MKAVNIKLEGLELTIYVDGVDEGAVELSIGLSNGEWSETFSQMWVNEFEGVTLPLVIDMAASVTPGIPGEVT